MSENVKKPRTLIGVLASHDDSRPNRDLIAVYTHIFKNDDLRTLIEKNYHFLFTGGTYKRVLKGNDDPKVQAADDEVGKWIREISTPLPPAYEGGVVLLSYFISQRECSIVWPFFAPNAAHWQKNENLAFMRLCDQWHVKRLMNIGSVMAWCCCEAKYDINRNLYPCPPALELRAGRNGEVETFNLPDGIPKNRDINWEALTPREMIFSKMTLALIAHNEMKSRMVEFAIDHERELKQFKRILATGTTGSMVAAATSEELSKKIVKYHSGPEGGDIEIATEVLCRKCDVIVFFIDPLRPHPHIEDIRVILQTCMETNRVIMITNEMHARDFMSRVVRAHEGINLFG